VKVARTKAELRESAEAMRRAGERVALVPTMGALHPGHLSLVERAFERADRVVLSVFVNPLQFGPAEDLDRYPRDLERDLELARSTGVDLVFTPDPDEMYPGGTPEITVDPGVMGERLCGAFRPGHFRGVLTVVAKLFTLVHPDVAVFGEKDFQQLVLIRRMARDLDLGVEVDGAPIHREEDGLAMSSRNALLSADARSEAAAIPRALVRVLSRFDEGERRTDALAQAFREAIEARPTLRLQYAEIVDPETLEGVEQASEESVAAVAVFAGETRLIDNVPLGADASGLVEAVRRASGGRDRAAAGDGWGDSDAAGGNGGHSVGAASAAGSTSARGGDRLHPLVRGAGNAVFPPWIRAGRDRKAHMLRVAALMGRWAGGLGYPPDEVLRWKAAGILHDALREEKPNVLRPVLRGALPELADLPDALLHGPAAAVRLREEGVDDEELLQAITFHTTGHPGLAEIGRALYAADFLEPGRPILRGWRAGRRSRMPLALGEVVREILEARIRHFVRPETAAFWSELTGGAALPAAEEPDGVEEARDGGVAGSAGRARRSGEAGGAGDADSAGDAGEAGDAGDSVIANNTKGASKARNADNAARTEAEE
jgi:pantoate--beta-alanine ligase